MAGLNHCTIQVGYVFLIIQWRSVVAIRDLDYFLQYYSFFVQVPIAYCNIQRLSTVQTSHLSLFCSAPSGVFRTRATGLGLHIQGSNLIPASKYLASDRSLWEQYITPSPQSQAPQSRPQLQFPELDPDLLINTTPRLLCYRTISVTSHLYSFLFFSPSQTATNTRANKPPYMLPHLHGLFGGRLHFRPPHFVQVPIIVPTPRSLTINT